MLPEITHVELPKFIDLAVKTGENLLIVGEPGIGKTVGVNAYKDENGFDLELSHPAVEDPTTIQGFPAKTMKNVAAPVDELDAMLGTTSEEKLVEAATFLPFGRQLRLMNVTKPTLWFIDDLGQAPYSMQAGLMQYLEGGRLNDFTLSPHVHIIAATNSREDKAGVRGLLEPVKSRFGLIVKLKVDVDASREYMYAKNMPHVITDFWNYDPASLHAWEPNLGMEKSPCPRLWEKLGKFILACPTLDPAFFEKMCIATIGEKYGRKFAAFCRVYAKLPSYNDVVADPENMPIDHPADIRYAIMGMLANKGKVEHSERLFTYVKKFAKEYQIIFMRTLSAGKSPLIDSRAARTWCAENAGIYLSALERANTAF